MRSDHQRFQDALSNESPHDQKRMIEDRKIEHDIAYAKRILVHYFRQAVPNLDRDCRTEIELAAEALFDAASERGARWGTGRVIGILTNGGPE